MGKIWSKKRLLPIENYLEKVFFSTTHFPYKGIYLIKYMTYFNVDLHMH